MAVEPAVDAVAAALCHECPTGSAGAGVGAGADVGASAGAGAVSGGIAGIAAVADPVHRFWSCTALHVPTKARADDVNGDADNGFRFAVYTRSSGSGSGVVTVTLVFVAGLNRTRETFLQIADVIEGDVRRVNRAWRRRLAHASGAPTATATATATATGPSTSDSGDAGLDASFESMK